jgi:hypothetical protein
MRTSSEAHTPRVPFANPALGLIVSVTAPAWRRWRRLTASLFDPYRPELHYMRGPGPRWREKHAQGGLQAHALSY